MSQEKPKWDGTSRVSNDNYRKRWNEIFNKKGSVVNTDSTFATDPNNEEYE